MLWGDLASDARAGIPQLVVMYRRIDHIKGADGWTMRIGAETVLIRLRGTGGFARWSASSFAIPWNDEKNLAGGS